MRRDSALSIRIPSDLKEALQARAEVEDRSLAYYVTRVLQAHIEDTPQPAPDKTKSRKSLKT